jgi:tetratricopeptide (TPR) repeat protein
MPIACFQTGASDARPQKEKRNMIARFTAMAILGLSLTVLSGSAQPVTEQLQKAIYAQETSGDLDAAIQIYRNIVNSAPTQRVLAAQAQLRLAQTLLQKGDLASAAREYQNLAINYSEFKDVIASMSGGPRGTIHPAPSISLGKLENGRYHHNLTGVEFSAPPGWVITQDSDSSGGGEIALLSNSNSKAEAFVWFKPNTEFNGDTQAQLRRALEAKAKDRIGVPDWTIRPSSVQYRTVAGQPAVSAVADYTENAQKMVESLTWAYSAKSHVFFFSRAAATDQVAVQSSVEQLLSSALIP